MVTVLLLIIYVAFISLGLPDAVLGAAWPIMQGDLSATFETAGYLFAVTSVGTVVSSLVSGKLLKRFGTGFVTAVSVLLTASALIGFSFAPSANWLYLFALPLGLGAGAVDAGLNDYVAVHFEAHHMNWLHSFWGVGATMGPILLAPFLTESQQWRKGYLLIAVLQFVLTAVLFLTVPLWRKVGSHRKNAKIGGVINREDERTSLQRYGQNERVLFALLTFLFYSGVEQTIGLWGSSYFVSSKGLSPVMAAQWISFYFLGITIGRMISGFVSFRISNRKLIEIGTGLTILGVFGILMNGPLALTFVSLMVTGIGLAPIFPSMIHETPVRFGAERSQVIMGYQMASAYVGTTILPPVFGLIANKVGTAILPWMLLFYSVAMAVSISILHSKVKRTA